MFYTPKPRQFRYQPRFYDPEKERWEMLKMKYAIEHGNASTETADDSELLNLSDMQDKEMEYFVRRVREFDREERKKKSGLTWKDMFRKREMPKFNYQPRFSASGEQSVERGEHGTGEHIAAFKKRNMKIKRRYDIADKDYMKPMPAGRIMLYAMLVCLLLYWVLF